MAFFKSTISSPNRSSKAKKSQPQKKRAKKYRSYTEEALAEAVDRIKRKDISQKKAAKQYGIPVMTLSDHVNGKVAIGKLLFSFFLL